MPFVPWPASPLPGDFHTSSAQSTSDSSAEPPLHSAWTPSPALPGSSITIPLPAPVSLPARIHGRRRGGRGLLRSSQRFTGRQLAITRICDCMMVQPEKILTGGRMYARAVRERGGLGRPEDRRFTERRQEAPGSRDLRQRHSSPLTWRCRLVSQKVVRAQL